MGKKGFGYDLETVMWKCASFMHEMLEAPKGNRDFDIIQQYMDEGQWEVHLRPNYLPKLIVSFSRNIDENYIVVSKFEQKQQYNAQF